jgi:hypothetical protein
VFRPLDQGATATTALQIYFADCTAPLASTACKPGAVAPITLTSTNAAAGTCLAPIAGTTSGYAPPITTPSAPCFASTAATVAVTIAGVSLTLHDARVAATYVGTPATQVVNGLLIGFVTEADANATILPASLPIVGGHALSFVLPGGDPPGPDKNCAATSDKDVDNGVMGWWFYINFTAPKVTWSDT